MIDIQDNKDLVRDPYSKAVLNQNLSKLQEHRKKKQMFLDFVDKFDKTDDRLKSLEHSVFEIKTLLTELINNDKKV